jgi:hypothetical protein
MNRRSALALSLVALVAALVAAPQASTQPGAKPTVARDYHVKLTVVQTRKWTFFHEQRSGCTRTQRGSGQEVITLSGTGDVGLPVRGGQVVLGLYPAGMTLSGKQSRVGQWVTTTSGPDCTDGGSTESRPVDGCITMPFTLQFATLEFNPRSARLTWQDGKVPQFKNCPDFTGSNVSEGEAVLPGSQLRNVTIPFGARLRDPQKFSATGTMKYEAAETCSTAGGTCDADYSHDATGVVESVAKITVVRSKSKR